MNTNPLVSIIVPVFNLGDYIDRTLKSIVGQTFLDWEVLVVDDGSTDNTPALVQKWANRDERIKFVRNQRSKGVSGARNTGIDIARGDWIAFLDGDDLFDESALETRVSASSAYPGCWFIGGDFIKFNSDEDLSGHPFSETNAHWRACVHGDLGFRLEPTLIFDPIKHFLVASLTWTGCVMIRAQLLRALSGFSEKLMSAEDSHLWLRVAASVDQMLFVPKSISYYRQRLSSLTNSGSPIYRDAVAAYQDLLDDPLFIGHQEQLIANIRAFAHSNTFFYRRHGQKLQAIHSALHAIRWDLFSCLSWKNFIATLLFR
nr:glycosyltransferase family 2 protein [Hydrogenophaga intermedia]